LSAKLSVAKFKTIAAVYLNIRRISMQIDLYTKIVLTIIAISLFALVIKPPTIPVTASAQPLSVMDVRIRGIEATPTLPWEAIHVVCDNCK
jgi:hypothetical protein